MEKYIDKLAERYPDLPRGLPVTVTVMDEYKTGDSPVTVTGESFKKSTTRNRQIEVWTLNINEGFQYATYSDLPRTKAFVRRFPDFLTAVLRGQIQPPPVNLVTLVYMRPWNREANIERKRIAEDEKVTVNTIRRREVRIRAGEPVNKPRPKGVNAVHLKHRALYNDAIRLRRQGLTGFEIAQKLDVPDKTLYRWFKK